MERNSSNLFALLGIKVAEEKSQAGRQNWTLVRACQGVAMISNLIDSLFGCSHKRLTFPITVKGSRRQNDKSTGNGTYVVCLDCGGEFAYDWKQMKVLGRREQTVTTLVPKTVSVKAA
jgi:hypothetical protein